MTQASLGPVPHTAAMAIEGGVATVAHAIGLLVQ
jgi:hypothetical protein